MSFSISLYFNPTEKNAFTKDLIHEATFEGVLRDDTSIIDPVIILECNLEDIANANYMHIPMFGRYYFINNMTSLRTNLVEISAHVDVLSSFKASILDNKAIVKRQEGSYNLYISDPKIGVYSKPNVSIKKFSNSFSGHDYILAVVGGRRSSNLTFHSIDVRTIYSSHQASYSSVGGSVGIGFDYTAYDGENSHTYRAYVGGKGFQTQFTSAGVWTYLQSQDPMVEHVSITDVMTTVWIPKPKTTDFKVKLYRTNTGYDTYMQESLCAYANTDPTNPDLMVKYNLVANTSYSDALEILFPHEEKRLDLEYCDAGLTP